MIDTICTAIATKVNSLGVLQTGVSAEVDYLPDLDFSEIRTQICKVLPQGVTTENETRASSKRDLSVNVVICEKLLPANLSARIANVETLVDGLERYSFGSGIVTGVSIAPLYDIDLMKEKRVFLSSLLVTVRVY